MSMNRATTSSTANYSELIEQLRKEILQADAIVIGAGSGLSTAAGLTYSGERFERNFADFIAKYQYADMYSAGFYPYDSPEEKWAYWSRHIDINRYAQNGGAVYADLLSLVEHNDYFVLTTNVDHCFQRAGFTKERLFYTQGDYGLWQCATPCHKATYDNEQMVKRMVKEQKEGRIPSDLIPRCPVCGGAMTMNLRCDDTFVEDEGWHLAAMRYKEYLEKYRGSKILYWELGVGGNTPGIIKYPFWQMTYQNPNAVYGCINLEEAYAPDEIAGQSLCIGKEIGFVLNDLKG